jgi:hypothetical protein
LPLSDAGFSDGHIRRAQTNEKKLKKLWPCFLSAAAIIIGSAGMTGRSEKRAMSEALYVYPKT